MRFTAIALLALGASTSAYVVPETKQVADNAVEARMPGSGPVRAANLVAALSARDAEAVTLDTREPHHRGKGKGKKNNRREPEVTLEARHHRGKGKGKKNNRREVDAEEGEDDADEDEVDLETRSPEPHHRGKGKGKKNNRREAEPEPHHRSKGKGKKNNRRDSVVESDDAAHFADVDLEARDPEPHHRGKGKGKKNNRREASPEPHHRGKGKGKKNNRREVEAEAEEDDAAHFADVDLEARSPEPHHRGKGKGKKNNRREAEPEPHHRGKGKGGKGNN